MAVRYLDPEDGSDALDGTTFANRKKTILSAFSGTAAGDEVRVIASPVANLGACTWTDNSRTITIPAGLVKVIEDANSGFTASANVTAGTNVARKSGATTVELTVASGFTTGKVAYKALAAALDLSAYQSVAFWALTQTAAPVGRLELRLCSDATGDVPVATIPFDDGANATWGNGWFIATKDFGAALPSGINSISVYSNSALGSNVIRLNNIVASKGKNAADHVSLTSAVSKQTAGEPEWYPPQSFTDTSLVIGAAASSTENTSPPRPYRGTTETVTTYAVRGMGQYSSSANRAPSGNGTLAAPKRLTGGWDRAAMATQSGVSWFSGKGNYAFFFDSGIINNYYSVENFAGMMFNSAFVNNLSTGVSVQLEASLGMPPVVESGQPGPSTIDVKQVWGTANPFGLPGNSNIQQMRVTLGRVHGCTGAGAAYFNNAAWFEDCEVTAGKIDNNAGYGMTSGDYTQRGYINGCVFQNNALGDLRTTGGQMAQIIAHNCSLGSTTPITLGSTDTAGEIVVSAQDGDPTRHSRIRRNSILTTDPTTRHTASGVSWKLTLQTALIMDANNPTTFKLADVAVRAGAPVTAKCWLRRDNAGLSAGIMVRGGRVAGVAATKQLMSAAINTWEQVTLTFTPTAAGVISIYGFSYGALFSAYFDDLEITQ